MEVEETHMRRKISKYRALTGKQESVRASHGEGFREGSLLQGIAEDLESVSLVKGEENSITGRETSSCVERGLPNGRK